MRRADPHPVHQKQGAAADASDRFGWAEVDEALLAHARGALERLPPGTAFSHVTAAGLLGWPISHAMARDERLHVIRRLGRSQVRLDGVVGHRAKHPREFVEVHGLPVVGPADTWTDLGELVGRGLPVGLDDLVITGDVAANQLGGSAPLLAALERRIRPRGKLTLAEALPLVRVGSASPRETFVRLMFVRAYLPEPRLNVPVYASWEPTHLLGVADLLWHYVACDGRERKVVGEYQGAQFHSSPDRRVRDAARRRSFEDDGWVVEEIWNDDVATEAARRLTVMRFATALGIEEALVHPAAAEPRFFSTHAMETALQRDARLRARRLAREHRRGTASGVA